MNNIESEFAILIFLEFIFNPKSQFPYPTNIEFIVR